MTGIILQQKLRKVERRFVRAYLRWGRQKKIPSAVNVEPTNICNLTCPICPHGATRLGVIPPFKRKRGYLTLETFDKILEGCPPHIRTMALYLHGEPFLNPHLPEMAKKAKENNILATIFTNGLLLKPDQIEQILQAQPQSITVSMDIISPKSYLLHKGVNLFHKACEQLLMIASVFARNKGRTKLFLRTIYGGEGSEDILAFLDRWFSVKGLHAIQVTHAFPWPRRSDANLVGSRLIANKDAECPQTWNALNICWNGTVTPCSFDYEAEYPIGNIHDAPLDKIINSRAARHFRRMHILGKRESIPLCSNCVLPRYLFEIVTVFCAQYARMNTDRKMKVLNRITNLQFTPVKDFP